jgi:23S rRNA pseudouridine955/2504/2580 synthase/23S rRNA pseudouridine1911/1915/1917 synthase
MIGRMERIAETKIRADGAGSSVMGYLCSRFTYAEEARWARYCRDGEVLLNGEPAAGDEELSMGDLLSFRPKNLEEPFARLDYRIVFEDEDFLILDKPAPLPCHPGGPFFKHSLWHALHESGRRGLHFAGRLDRETSGLMAACKNEEALRSWNANAASGGIEKAYRAIVHGDFPESLCARGFIQADRSSAIRKKAEYLGADGAAPGPDARPCRTDFRLLSRERGLSLVEAVLATGRTHQIRATLHSLGYPVLGDKLYGLDESFFLRFRDGSLSGPDLDALVLDRQALHSAVLRFPGPGGRTMEFFSDPPWDFPPSR